MGIASPSVCPDPPQMLLAASKCIILLQTLVNASTLGREVIKRLGSISDANTAEKYVIGIRIEGEEKWAEVNPDKGVLNAINYKFNLLHK